MELIEGTCQAPQGAPSGKVGVWGTSHRAPILLLGTNL